MSPTKCTIHPSDEWRSTSSSAGRWVWGGSRCGWVDSRALLVAVGAFDSVAVAVKRRFGHEKEDARRAVSVFCLYDQTRAMAALYLICSAVY